MASYTDIVRRKRKRRFKNAGKARKARQGKRSTLSYAEVFAGLGAPRDAAEAPTDAGDTAASR
ncbi:MAG: hypothetical protein B7733_00900 [Myxococcales bacterium FL481]|nr:MAG: hypothetical protein B7733_00900 [Myxococcales bacterium FL481]